MPMKLEKVIDEFRPKRELSEYEFADIRAHASRIRNCLQDVRRVLGCEEPLSPEAEALLLSALVGDHFPAIFESLGKDAAAKADKAVTQTAHRILDLAKEAPEG